MLKKFISTVIVITIVVAIIFPKNTQGFEGDELAGYYFGTVMMSFIFSLFISTIYFGIKLLVEKGKEEKKSKDEKDSKDS